MIIGEAAMNQGFNVVLSEIHGMSQREGSVSTELRIGDFEGSILPDHSADMLLSFEPIEIQNYFSEFQGYRCKYNDCYHYNEPYKNCAVKQAVVDGSISMERFESYVKIMGDVLDGNSFDLIIQDLHSRK